MQRLVQELVSFSSQIITMQQCAAASLVLPAVHQVYLHVGLTAFYKIQSLLFDNELVNVKVNTKSSSLCLIDFADILQLIG